MKLREFIEKLKNFHPDSEVRADNLIIFDNNIGIFDESKLLTIGEVAKVLNTSWHTIYRWMREGNIPVLRLGHGKGSLRFDPKKLNLWLSTKVGF